MTDENSPTPDIETLLAELAASELSTAAFARERRVPAWKLYNALRSRKAKASKALVPVVLRDEAEQGGVFQLQLSSGHRLSIPPDFDEHALRRLMGALAGC